MKRKPKPDTRPHWNDDLRIMYNKRLYTADEWQKMCARAIATDMTPHYSKDPTYNLKVKRER